MARSDRFASNLRPILDANANDAELRQFSFRR
jgi:hypothetical protein